MGGRYSSRIECRRRPSSRARPPRSASSITTPRGLELQLQLWAAFPDKNPLNSPRLAGGPAGGRAIGDFALTQFYTLGPLGAGATPNRGALPGADLRATLTSDHGGVAAGFLDGGLFDLLRPGGQIDANLDGAPDAAPLAALSAAPLGNGQSVAYTLHYENGGVAVAKDVRVTARAYGALRYPVVAALSSFVMILLAALVIVLAIVARRFGNLGSIFSALRS